MYHYNEHQKYVYIYTTIIVFNIYWQQQLTLRLRSKIVHTYKYVKRKYIHIKMHNVQDYYLVILEYNGLY